MAIYDVLPKEGSMPGVLAYGSPAWQARQAAQQSGQNYTDPYGYSYNYSGTVGSGSLPARESYPATSSLNAYTDMARNYPTYMRNLGENLAQQQFQAAARSFRPGDAAQQYQAALGNQNMARLGYMAQAGKEEATLAQQQQALLNQLYGLNIQQRGQDVGYAESMMNANARMSGGGGGSVIRIGGGGSGASQPGKYYSLAGDLNKDFGGMVNYGFGGPGGF